MSAAAEVREIVAASRAAQGLPETIEDPATVADIAAIIQTRSGAPKGAAQVVSTFTTDTTTATTTEEEVSRAG